MVVYRYGESDYLCQNNRPGILFPLSQRNKRTRVRSRKGDKRGIRGFEEKEEGMYDYVSAANWAEVWMDGLTYSSPMTPYHTVTDEGGVTVPWGVDGTYGGLGSSFCKLCKKHPPQVPGKSVS